MNKVELIESMAGKSGLTKKDAGLALKALIETVQETVGKKEEVAIVGFGNFKARERAAREGHNPKTKEKINIPATTVPAFKAGKAFRDAVK